MCIKNAFALFGVIALAAVIGFGAAGCKDPVDSGSKSLIDITVTSPPDKVQYDLGEDFDPAGMVITANYSDGSKATVTNYTLSGYDKTATGNQTITVSYNGKTANFGVRVIDPGKETAATPTANPPAGTYTSAQTVTLTTTTPEAAIYYTLDGSTPDATSSLFNSSISIAHSLVLKAIAVKSDMNDSTVLEAAYTIQTVTPIADDFVIDGATSYTYDGTPKSVTITPKQGKSTGARTIYYNGSTTAPSTVGTYTVTFDVAAVTGFNSATGLAAGTLTIVAATPTADDFVIGNLTQPVGSVMPVAITPKAGKSGGDITIYYNGSTTLPTAAGTYTVTFDVAAITGFNAKAGLAAGTLTIVAAHVLGIEFTGFDDEAIDLTKSTENDIKIGESLTVTVTGDFGIDDFYVWYLNGKYLYDNYSTNSVVVYTGAQFPIGIHTITVVVHKYNGTTTSPYSPYSKEITFRVVR